MSQPPDVRVRRVYDRPSATDGARVLVDRLWPRGVAKDTVQLDDWAKDAAPSAGLRLWYGHDECGAVTTEGHRPGCDLAEGTQQ
jgi:uncharacterized protein YeaO (DUF488 family)